MQPVPRIFVSATSRDLTTARTLVSEGLRRMESLPIVQDDFPPDYKSVRDMLMTKIKTCDAVIHIAGFYYGAEPQPVPPDPERRSFTQMEYEIAMELGLPCYVFLCGEKFPFDEHDPEPEEKRKLQLAHRERLLSRDELFYEFESREDLNARTRELQLSVESLRDELAQERKRRRMTLVVSAVALLVALIGGVALFNRTRSQQTEIEETVNKLDEQGEVIAMLLAERERLRAKGGSGDLVALAEENIARATNRSPEEIRGVVESAIASAEKAVDAATDDLSRAAALEKLADAQLAAGFWAEAVENQRERLELIDRGQDPAAWADAVGDLATSIFQTDPRSEETIKLVAEASDWVGDESRLGPEHPNTIRLVELLRDGFLLTGRDEGAVTLAKKAVEAWENTVGPEAPQTMGAVGTMARIYKILRDFEKSDPLFNRVIETREKLLGPDHRDTLSARWDLAQSYEIQRRFSEAEAIYVDLVRRSTEQAGEGDADTLALLTSLGFVHEARSDEKRAVEVFRDVYEKAREHRGEDDEITLSQAGLLAVKLNELGEHEEAETLYRQILDSRTRTLGVNQPKTIDAMLGLSITLSKLGKTEEYLDIMRQRIAAQIQVFGPDRLDIAQNQDSAALALAGEGDWMPALSFAEEALNLRKRVLGESHADTLESFSFVQLLANRSEDWELAERWGTMAVEAFDKAGKASAQSHAEVLYRMAVAEEELGKDGNALGHAKRAAALAAEHVDEEHWLHDRTAEMIERLQ